MPHEASQVLQKVFMALREEGVTKAAVANQLAIDSEEINELTFGLMLNALKGGGEKATRSTANLRLVKG